MSVTQVHACSDQCQMEIAYTHQQFWAKSPNSTDGQIDGNVSLCIYDNANGPTHGEGQWLNKMLYTVSVYNICQIPDSK